MNTKNINYNLLINCTGPKSKFTKKNVSNGIYKNYKETAVTAFIEHSKFKNSTAKQFFTTDGPLALLPITDNKTSAIWSLKSKFLPDKYINKNKVVKKKIKLFLKDYLKIVIMPPLISSLVSGIILYQTKLLF